MKIELKQVLTLTAEEKKAINKTYLLMNEIMEEINDPDIYNATKQICDGLEEFGYLVDTKVE